MKKQVLLWAFVLVAGVSSAQDKFFYLNWDINTPLSNTSWLKDSSPRGLKAGYRGFLNDRFSVGVDLGWSSFDQYFPTETFYTETGALTTDYFNYVNTFTAAASGQYNFKLDSKHFFPYAGLGLGAMQTEYKVYYNIYTESEKTWGFLARPELGVLVKISDRRSIGLMAALHYDYATNKSVQYDYPRFTSFGFQVGLIMMDW